MIRFFPGPIFRGVLPLSVFCGVFMPEVRVSVYAFVPKDRLKGVSAKGSPYDFVMQYGLVHQGKARPVIAVVRRADSVADLLAPGEYLADLVLEDRKGVLVAAFEEFRPLAPSAVSKAG